MTDTRISDSPIITFLRDLVIVLAVIAPHLIDASNGFYRGDIRVLGFYLMGTVLYFFVFFLQRFGPVRGGIWSLGITAFIWLFPMIIYSATARAFLPVKVIVGITTALVFTPVWVFVMIFDMNERPEKYNAFLRLLAILYMFGLIIVVFFGAITSNGRMLISSSSYRAPVMQAFAEFLTLARNALSAMWSGLVLGVDTFTGKTGPAIIDNTVSEIVGQDYYYGTVEETKDEPMGVYLKDVRTADPEYHVGDRVVVWGTVEAKTFDKPINIQLRCYALDTNQKRYEGSIDKPAKNPFTVTKYGDAPFQCIYDNLPVEVSNLVVEAEFNFQTLAYMRTYFMRSENLLAKMDELRDNGKDYTYAGVLSSYGLPSSPTAYYTNGPVSIGMGTSEPPVRVDPESGISPYIGVMLSNSWSTGVVKKITKLDVLVPKPITIDTCGNDNFGPAGATPNRNEENYNKYSLDIGSSKKVDNLEENSASFRCLMNIGLDALDNTPGPTTRTLKAYTEYTYVLKSEVPVTIKKVA